MGYVGLVVLGEQRGSGDILGAFTRDVENVEDARDRLTSIDPNSRATYWRVAWEEWKEHPLTGTGAGTFSYTWLENRPGFGGLKQVHNVFLEQGTETGVVAFLALTGFAVILTGYAGWAALRATGERRVLLAGLTGAVIVYLVSSALEWHWYIPASTIYFFVMAGVTVRLAARAEPTPPDGIRE
jgi:O-antigen ligase